jgi:uncharacterized protein
MPADDRPEIARSRLWLERAVIGLNLCPFAKAVHLRGQVRWVLSHATTEEDLLAELVHELNLLQDASVEEVETTLIVHPHVLDDFEDYNQFLDIADAAISELDLEGEIQVASFHPQYRFAGSEPDAIDDYSNRSPYPMLHLLREASIARAVAAFPDAERIYSRNIETLRAFGHAGWRALWADTTPT